jgi:hypothetical protein
MRFIKILPLLLTLACQEAVDTSSLSWAHSPADKSGGTILGRLTLLQLGVATDFNPYRVCVQNDSSLPDQQVLLEVQLAYAAWLHAATDRGGDLWNFMTWKIQDSCSDSDRSFSSVVVIASSEDIPAEFDRAPLICGREGRAGCMTGGQTLGMARVGTNQYTESRGKTLVQNVWPSTLQITPLAQWHGLDYALPKLMTEENKASIDAALQKYQQLLAGGKTRSFDNLVDLIRIFDQHKLTEGQDEALLRAANEFRASTIPSINSYYTPEIALYSILLHEAGHQFGMSHAHEPKQGSETGHTGDGKYSKGVWVTQDSAMSYNDSYFHLTKDDKAGIRDLATKLKLYFQRSTKI